jgi:hypothetical protein
MATYASCIARAVHTSYVIENAVAARNSVSIIATATSYAAMIASRTAARDGGAAATRVVDRRLRIASVSTCRIARLDDVISSPSAIAILSVARRLSAACECNNKPMFVHFARTMLNIVGCFVTFCAPRSSASLVVKHSLCCCIAKQRKYSLDPRRCRN